MARSLAAGENTAQWTRDRVYSSGHDDYAMRREFPGRTRRDGTARDWSGFDCWRPRTPAPGRLFRIDTHSHFSDSEAVTTWRPRAACSRPTLRRTGRLREDARAEMEEGRCRDVDHLHQRSRRELRRQHGGARAARASATKNRREGRARLSGAIRSLCRAAAAPTSNGSLKEMEHARSTR